MRHIFAIFLVSIACNAHSAPPTEESIEKLFAAMKIESTLEAVYGSTSQAVRQSMQAAVQGKALSAEQQRLLELVPGRLVAVMREELNWPKMKPLYMEIYRSTFEQDEVDGLIAFYASPAGRAFIDKMPVAMQKVMASVQSTMQSLMPKIDAALKAALAEAKLTAPQ